MSRRQNVVRKEERISPTPETLAKLRPAPWAHLDVDLQKAAVALAQGFYYIIHDIGHRTGGFERRISGQFVMPEHIDELIDRYDQWCDEMKSCGWARYIFPVIDVLFFDDLATDVDFKKRWRPGTTAAMLIEAVKLYQKKFKDL